MSIRVFAIKYILLSTLLLLLQPYTTPEVFVEAFALFLAHSSALTVWIFDSSMVLEGAAMRAENGFGVWVTEACMAFSHTLLLIAAILSYTCTMPLKAYGVLAAIICIQILNIFRLVTLYFVQKWTPKNFDIIHEEIWPIAFTLGMLGLFFTWLWYLDKQKIATGQAANA